MAQQRYLDLLNKGVKVWNSWRNRYPQEKPDLSQADLRGIDVRSINFSQTNLSQANLSEVNLSNANCTETNFLAANLSYCKLYYSKLKNTYLKRANLDYAYLKVCHLDSCNFENTSFIGTKFENIEISQSDFSNAVFGLTRFRDLSLAKALGLEESHHKAPSSLGIEVRHQSGQLSSIFLKGIGLADWEIEEQKLYDPKLSLEDYHVVKKRVEVLTVMNPLQDKVPFILYSLQDDEVVQALCRFLDKNAIRYYAHPQDKLEQQDFKLKHHFIKAIPNSLAIIVLSANAVEQAWFQEVLTEAQEIIETEGGSRHVIVKLEEQSFLAQLASALQAQLAKFKAIPLPSATPQKDQQAQFQDLLTALDLYYKPAY